MVCEILSFIIKMNNDEHCGKFAFENAVFLNIFFLSNFTSFTQVGFSMLKPLCCPFLNSELKETLQVLLRLEQGGGAPAAS